jgi:hypothetical protein
MGRIPSHSALFLQHLKDRLEAPYRSEKDEPPCGEGNRFDEDR